MRALARASTSSQFSDSAPSFRLLPVVAAVDIGVGAGEVRLGSAQAESAGTVMLAGRGGDARFASTALGSMMMIPLSVITIPLSASFQASGGSGGGVSACDFRFDLGFVFPLPTGCLVEHARRIVVQPRTHANEKLIQHFSGLLGPGPSSF